MRSLRSLLALVLVVFTTMTTQATAQDKEFGIVSGRTVVSAEVAKKQISIRGLRVLNPGAPCNLLPGDKVRFVAEENGQIAVQRIRNTNLPRFSAIRKALTAGRSDTCPFRAVVKVGRAYKQPWSKLNEAVEADRGLRRGKKDK